MVGANHLIANASVGTFLATGFFFCKATFEGAFNGTAGTPLSPILRRTIRKQTAAARNRKMNS